MQAPNQPIKTGESVNDFINTIVESTNGARNPDANHYENSDHCTYSSDPLERWRWRDVNNQWQCCILVSPPEALPLGMKTLSRHGHPPIAGPSR